MAETDDIPEDDPEAIEREADDIRRQTRDIRDRLPDAVDGIKEQTEQLLDWRHYVRTYPAISMVVAAAVGYLIVPRGKKPPKPPAPVSTLARIIPGLAPAPEPVETSTKGSFVDGILGSASAIALKVVASYAGEQLTQMLSPKTSKTTETNGEHNHEPIRPAV